MENVIVVDTEKSVEEASTALERAVAEHRFGILHVHHVRQTLAAKGIALDRDVRIFDVCNPQRAKQVLDRNPLVAAALPCAIAIVGAERGSQFVFLRPTAILGLFGAEELREAAQDIERSVTEIVEQAAR